MAWKPISEENLGDAEFFVGTNDHPSKKAVGDNTYQPKKWQQHPYGDQGGGFWAVAILGRTVIWYNDIEEGFNVSAYSQYGEIGVYWCNQDSLR